MNDAIKSLLLRFVQLTTIWKFIHQFMQKTISHSIGVFLLATMSIFIAHTATANITEQAEEQTKTLRRTNWGSYLKKDASWYKSAEAMEIAYLVMLYQRESGGWPKNIDITTPRKEKEKKAIAADKKVHDSTIDNGSTYPQLRFLAKVYQATANQKILDSFMKGYGYILESQYSNGGWPQFYPLRKGYYSHVTFNDNAMTEVLNFLHDVGKGAGEFSFLSDTDRERARNAEQKGLDIILKTQIEVNGKMTGWCAQYDENTLEPADARSYELASISGMETVGLVEYLMSIENPTPQIVKAIQSACEWLESSKITGYRMQYDNDPASPRKFNRYLVEDPNAKPLWARFYDIETNKPLYIDRGGIRRENHNDLSDERRNGYAYVGDFASSLLYKEFPKWKKANNLP
jgi:PelA/Pel-15E family pectate lyase